MQWLLLKNYTGKTLTPQPEQLPTLRKKDLKVNIILLILRRSLLIKNP
jgi:hypothetical protein